MSSSGNPILVEARPVHRPHSHHFQSEMPPPRADIPLTSVMSYSRVIKHSLINKSYNYKESFSLSTIARARGEISERQRLALGSRIYAALSNASQRISKANLVERLSIVQDRFPPLSEGLRERAQKSSSFITSTSGERGYSRYR